MKKTRAEFADVFPLFEDFNDRNDSCDDCPFFCEECNGVGGERCFCEDVFELLKRGRDLEGVQPVWNNVKDNPPDETKDVIAYNAFGEMMIGSVYETSRGRYKCADGYSEDMLSVTHWMSRPEPPKEDE